MGISAEQYAWPEGSLLVWTGSAAPYTASYVSKIGIRGVRGWANFGPTFGGQYADVLTGQRVDVTIDAAYTYDTTLQRIFESATAVHMHVWHNSVNGSAGMLMWSGRVTEWGVAGQEGGLYAITLAYYANTWSAY